MSLFFNEKRRWLLVCVLTFIWHNSLFEDGFHVYLDRIDCFGIATIGLQVIVICRLEPLMSKELLATIYDGYFCLAKEWGSCKRIQKVQQVEKSVWPLEQEGIKQKERRRISGSEKFGVDQNVIQRKGRKSH